MNKCVRCGKEYRMEDVENGNVLIEMTGLHVGSRIGDHEARDKQCNIMKEYGDGIKLCPQCTDRFLRWMKNPGAMYVEDYEAKIEKLESDLHLALEKINDREHQVYIQDGQISDLIDENRKLYNERRDLLNNNKHLQKKLDDMREISSAVADERDAAIESADRMEDMLANLGGELHDKDLMIDRLNRELGCMKSEAEESSDKKEIAYLEKQLLKSETEKRHLRDIIKVRENELREAEDATLDKFKDEMMKELHNVPASDIKRFIVDVCSRAMYGDEKSWKCKKPCNHC